MTEKLSCYFLIQPNNETTVLYKTTCFFLKNKDKVYEGFTSYIQDSILYLPYSYYYIQITIPDKMLEDNPFLTNMFNKRTEVKCNFYSKDNIEDVCLKDISFPDYSELDTGIFRLFLKLDILTYLQNVTESDLSKITENISEYTIHVTDK